jgi:hypothetical protein
MSIARPMLALAWLVLTSAPASAVDLTKIDRTIAKEPAYKSKPKYCLLVFGPEAKTRVWLVLDGDVLYVDRNGNGDLTEKGEGCPVENDDRGTGWRKCVAGDLVEPDGKTVHRGLYVHFYATDQIALKVRTHSGREYWLWYDVGGGAIAIAARPQDAPVVHFDGPLTLALVTSRGQTLIRGDKAVRLAFQLGTPGLGKNTFASINPEQAAGNAAIRPRADVEFPNKRPGGDAIRLTLTLDWDP